MNWKFILKTSIFVGIMLIIPNIFSVLYSIYQFYGVARITELILLISMYAIALVSTTSFVYRKTLQFRITQSILTVVFSVAFGYILTVAIVFAFLIFAS